MDKKALRRQYQEQFEHFPKEQAAAGSFAVFLHLFALPQLAAARRVFCYLAMPGEVATRPILRRLWEQGKILYAPRIVAPGVMQAAIWRPDVPCAPGKLGILQPPDDAPAATELDLALVPGLAFDAQGGRLGRGGGYYDRFLAETPCQRVALGFNWQLSPHPLPMEEHDARMHRIVLPSGVVEV